MLTNFEYPKADYSDPKTRGITGAGHDHEVQKLPAFIITLTTLKNDISVTSDLSLYTLIYYWYDYWLSRFLELPPAWVHDKNTAYNLKDFSNFSAN